MSGFLLQRVKARVVLPRMLRCLFAPRATIKRAVALAGNPMRAALVVACFFLAAGLQAYCQSSGVMPADRMGEGWWAERHKALLATVATHPAVGVVLVGDSITNNYDKSKLPDENFQPTWQQFYAPRRALNLGFSGDTTSNVLWRLQHGEVDGLHPKVAVLLIGTNDTGFAGRGADETTRGVEAVVAELEAKLPATKILLVGILPSAISDAKSATDRAINLSLAQAYGGDPRVTYLDIGSIFYNSQGQLDTAIYYDPRLPQHGKPLHPDTVGQRKMAEAIEPVLARLMGDASRSPAPAAAPAEAGQAPRKQ